MEQYIQSILFFLFACLPAFLFRSFPRKRFGWCFLPCALLGALFLYFFPRTAFLLYALLLGLFLFFAVYRPLKIGKLSGFFLCWSGSLSILCIGHLYIISPAGLTLWFFLAFVFVVSLSFGLAAYWLFRWTAEDTFRLSEERRISPLPPLIMITCFQFLLTFFGEFFPVGCVLISVALQIILLMILSLWNNMTLSVRHSQESSENSRQSAHLIDHASRSSAAELQRQLTESRNKLHQARLAYHSGNKEVLDTLLDLPEEQSGSYCSQLLLDAILRHSAHEAQEVGLLTNFKLQLGSMRDFPLSDIGVLLGIMLELLSEPHPGKPDTLRLRMQEWSDALVIVVGRREPLRVVPESKMNTLRQLAEEYHGWAELAEKEHGICLSAVLFRPAGEK